MSKLNQSDPRLPKNMHPTDCMESLCTRFRYRYKNPSLKKNQTIDKIKNKKKEVNRAEDRRDIFGFRFLTPLPKLTATSLAALKSGSCEFTPRTIAPSISQMQHGHPSSMNSCFSALSSIRDLSLVLFPYGVGSVRLISIVVLHWPREQHKRRQERVIGSRF